MPEKHFTFSTELKLLSDYCISFKGALFDNITRVCIIKPYNKHLTVFASIREVISSNIINVVIVKWLLSEIKYHLERRRDARAIVHGNYVFFYRRTLTRGTLPGYPLVEVDKRYVSSIHDARAQFRWNVIVRVAIVLVKIVR